MIKILIYDNEWSDILKSLPFELTFAYNEDEVYEKTFKKKFDFYIFDFENGYKVLEELRKAGDETFSIFLSNIETFNSQIKAYKIGDDFFKKRFTYIEEIRIKLDYYIKKFFQLKDIIKYKNIYFYPKLHQIYINSKKINLTTIESELLILFFKNKDKYLSKEIIIDYLNITEGTIKVKISNLRKMGFDIINKKEFGYRLEEKNEKNNR